LAIQHKLFRQTETAALLRPTQKLPSAAGAAASSSTWCDCDIRKCTHESKLTCPEALQLSHHQ